MGLLNNKGIVFHDRAGGGWYCNGCKRYLHPDMRDSHKHTWVTDLVASNIEPPRTHTKSATKALTENQKKEK